MNARTCLQLSLLGILALGTAYGVDTEDADRFRQLDEILPTANSYRTASGAPGHEYWQQKVDYVIDVTLDEDVRKLIGFERITYLNNSPDTLNYLWVQLDQNRFHPDSHSVQTALGPDPEGSPSYREVQRLFDKQAFDGGVKIKAVGNGEGGTLEHTVNGTMLRVDLPEPLVSGASTVFTIDWEHMINDHDKLGGRGGYEHFEKDGNDIFEIAQWFPRLCAYTDVNGWQNKQFLGRGEFSLEFGDYEVNITVPSDHIVASTGVLQNPKDVLTQEQMARYEESRTAPKPMFVVTPEEAEVNEKSRSRDLVTWSYYAKNVRDFAWASSRKFIWDSKGQMVGDREVMAMSYYPKEGEPLWSRYSTHSILHTLEVYSRYTFDYPYPVAISVNGPVGGMEYPMICFNGPRPEEDGTYTARTKYGLISVIIHEVGHNWFPMIVNSDERQWTWMDEGVNTFLQYLAEQEWEEDYPSWRGKPDKIVSFMSSDYQVPIMTNSESLKQFGNNAYAKPAAALNVLRETVMGRELFDFAFKEYSNRWRFKRPEPSDLFRTMEDASAVDLDWFWNGWFYTTEAVDLSVDGVTRYQIDTQDPDIEKPLARAEEEAQPTRMSDLRNKGIHRRMDDFPELADFYNSFDKNDVTVKDRRDFEKMVEGLKPEQKEILKSDFNFYAVEISNVGGLLSPVIFEFEYVDGTTEEMRYPAEIWIKNAESLSKLVTTKKEVVRVTLDPHLETADIDLSNNVFPPEIGEKRLKLRKRDDSKRKNPMQKAREAEELLKKEANAGADTAGAAADGASEGQ